MVKGVEIELTGKYIKQLIGYIENSEKELNKAKRWYGRKKIRHNYTEALSSYFFILGVNQFILDQFNESKASFIQSVKYLKESIGIRYTVPGYNEIQRLASGIFSGDYETVKRFSIQLFNMFDIEEPLTTIKYGREVIKSDYAVKAILGWIAGADREKIKQMASICYSNDDKDLKRNQFKLWISCVYSGMEKNSDLFNENMEYLAEFVKKQCRYGDLKYSEDRYIYFPGLLLIYLAKEDGLNIKIPKIRQYPEAIFSL